MRLIEQSSPRGRDSYIDSRRLFEFVGVAPSRRMTWLPAHDCDLYD